MSLLLDEVALATLRLADAGVESPRTDAELAIAAVWKDVLGIDEIGVNDNFFALGGHSLLGMRVLSRIQQQFGLELGLRALFDTPTIAGLATAVGTAEPLRDDRDGPELVRVDRESRRVSRAGVPTSREDRT